MKSFGYYFGMFVAATMAFTACKKEITPEDEPQEITHTMTINLGKVDSKTAVVEGEESASYIWTLEDKPCFHVYESTTDADGKVSKTEGNVDKVTFSEDMTTASLSVSFTGTQSGPYTYSVVYAGKLNTSKNPLIPAEQNPRLDNFDPKADVLISKPIVSDTRLEELSMIMGRVSTINKMTLKGLEEGEKISKVEFTLDKGLSASYVLDSGNYSTHANKLTLTYTSVEALVSEGGTFPVYFVSAPVDKAAIVSVVVTTDKKVYTKSSTQTPNPFDGKTITFAVGVMKRFGMDMTGCGEAISTGGTYVKATSKADFVDSQNVIIVGAKESTYYAMGSQKDNNRDAINITSYINETVDKIVLDNTSSVHTFTLETTKDGHYTFYDNDGNTGYLYSAGTDNNNYLKSKASVDNTCYWNISFDAGAVSVLNVGNSTKPDMRFNISSTLFSCYSKGSQSQVMIFVDPSSKIPTLGQPQNLEVIADGNAVMISWDKVENAQLYRVTCGENTDEVEASDNPTAIFTGLADGKYDISVIAATSDGSYKDSQPATTDIRVGAIKKYKAYFSVNGQSGEGTEYEEGTTISFPSDPSIEGVEFMGWTTSAIPTPQATAPDFVNTESTVMRTEDITFYAVFATQVGDANTPVQTLAYDTWTYSGTTTDQSTYRLFHSDSYIESAEFDLSTLIKVVVYGGTYGGTSYNKLTIGDGTNTWKSVTVNGKEATGVNTYTDGTPLKGIGKLRITSNSGSTSGNGSGVRISKVEIYALGYSDYCTNVVTLSSISVSGNPTKTEYTVYDAFEPAGLTVTGTYSDGTTADITDGISWTCDPSTFDASGNKIVEVKATVKSIESAAYNVNVTVNTITNTLDATNKSIDVNADLDVTSLFTRKNSNAEIKYTLVENPSGAGTLTGTIFSTTAAGTYTVKASQDATTTHSAAAATATITVNKLSQTLSFEKSNYSVNVAKASSFTSPKVSGAYSNVVYSILLADGTSDGAITIDSNSGELTINSVGEATISATAEENEAYYSATASYTIKVTSSTVKWVLVSDLSNLTEGTYILASVKTTNTWKYMPNSASTSSNPALKGLSAPIDDTIEDDKVTSDMKWSLVSTGTNSQFYIRPYEDSTIGLGCTSSTGAKIRISSTYKDTKWTFSISKAANWVIKSNASMYLAVYSDSEWRNYTNTTTNQNGKFYLFKQVSE